MKALALLDAYPWLAIPAALVAVLVVARLARLRPSVRPVVGPFALTAAAWAAFHLSGWPLVPEHRWFSLAVLVPLLMLVVRGAVIAFEGVFRRRQGAAPPQLLESVVSVLLYGVGAGFLAHHLFGVELTPFLATSAVVGAVVGLALQDTLGNLFAGIALHTEAPFRVGDWVRLGSRDGRVDQVSWRAMRLLTWDGDLLTVPNNEVSRHEILNYSNPKVPHSRVLTIGVNYHTPPNKVLSVLRGLLEQVPQLVRDPAPVLRIIAFGDFAITYEVRYWVPDYPSYRTIEGEINRLIWYHFKRHGIEIPFPIRNVYLHQADAVAAQRDLGGTSRLERALRTIDLFRPLSDDELRAAAARFRALHYAAGERIIEEGAPGDSFFVIDRGEVSVHKSFGGVSRPLARLMEGQFFGEMALLTGERRTATVIAATDVDLFTIDKRGFQDILVANPAITVDISTILAERRDALAAAEGDVTNRFDDRERETLRHSILQRIRSYFGL